MLRRVETAVVTGAGRGLGREICRRLADRGLAIVAADIDGESAVAAAAEIGHGARGVALDVRDPAACRVVAAEASEAGRLAVWVNNAGVSRSERVWDHADDDVELIVATNLLGVVHGSRAAIEVMRRHAGGRILNVASMSSHVPAPGLAVYGATKQGVLAFSIALQAELRDAGVPIEVRSVCPDPIDTAMVRSQVDAPEAAILWTATRVLTASEVADRAVGALYGERLVTSVPRWRAAALTLLGLVPRLAVRLLPPLKRLGERNRRRWLAAERGY
jgi:NAD(P)-dependent dehydrogenase (short-subunit alcohol dehydrogenase family)